MIQKLININNNQTNEETFIDNNINNEKDEKNINEYYINKSIQWIKDILKIILKMICLSEENYLNFQKIVISLIGSIAEILNTLTDLPNNFSSLLFKDEIFFLMIIKIFVNKIIYAILFIMEV